MSSGFSGRGKRVPRAIAPAVDAAGRGSAASADSACGRSGCAYPTMRGAAGGRIAPGAGAFDSAKGARAMHATRDGRSRVRHGPIGRLASSRTGHEAIGSEDATAGVCALGVRDLHAFSLHRVRTVLTAAPPASTKRGTFPSQIVRASYEEWSQRGVVLRGVRRWTPQRGDAMRVRRCVRPTLSMQTLLHHSCIKEVRAFFGSRMSTAWLAMQPFDSTDRCGRIRAIRGPG